MTHAQRHNYSYLANKIIKKQTVYILCFNYVRLRKCLFSYDPLYDAYHLLYLSPWNSELELGGKDTWWWWWFLLAVNVFVTFRFNGMVMLDTKWITEFKLIFLYTCIHTHSVERSGWEYRHEELTRVANLRRICDFETGTMVSYCLRLISSRYLPSWSSIYN